jgi:hypothetical protein
VAVLVFVLRACGSTEMDLKEMGSEFVNWIHLVQEKVQCR